MRYQPSEYGAPIRVAILHTNDFHNHLTPAQARTLSRAKESAGDNALLLDAGDAISAGNVGVRPGGEPILTLMSETGYDAMTLGNREFHVSDAALRHKIGQARFPILCANIRYRKAESGSRSLPVIPYLRKTLRGGARIAVIGVTVPMVTSRMSARHLSAYLFDDPVRTAADLAQELRPSADLIIALTHIGIKADEELSRLGPALDLIVTGHSHVVVEAGERTTGVPIVQTGWFGHNYGGVTFELGAGRPKIAESFIAPLEPAQG